MTVPATPAEPATPVPSADLWKPVLTRASVALVFGAVTIFWAQPSVLVLGGAGGLYLVATGLALLWSVRKTGFRRDERPGRLLAAGPSIMTGAGVALLFLPGDLMFGVFAALALTVVGAVELYIGIRYRRHPLGRDWAISGVIGVGTAVALPFFISLGAHALLGVAGGGAIISGVLWMLAGLTLRYDARAASAKAVN
ncbi:hypothetical protein ACW0JT_04250 [Arthrobacter sp. SA17]